MTPYFQAFPLIVPWVDTVLIPPIPQDLHELGDLFRLGWFLDKVQVN